MTFPDQGFVTVDMRSLKAALVARARAERVSVSVLVRAAVANALGAPETAGHEGAASIHGEPPAACRVKISVRLSAVEAGRLVEGARAAGLSRGAFLAGLVAGVPVLGAGGHRGDHLAALTASTAEVATLSRSLSHLVRLLREENFRPAQEYLPMLAQLGVDIHRHLELAAKVLADLRPRRACADSDASPVGSGR